MYHSAYTRFYLAIILFSILSCGPATKEDKTSAEKNSYTLADSLISVMTIEEKAGQLNFLVGDLFNTGPTVNTSRSERFDSLIRVGQITGLFNIHGASYLTRLQKISIEESRLGIPLVFGADVIHGFKTVFPIPLATAASWDPGLIERAEQVAAKESTAGGINFNFAPMVDISRDPRWGRMAEGAGEDPFLGSVIAAARVRGFQGTDLKAPNTMAACVKHYAAYGAAYGGRDYNTTDMSERVLREIYLPPFKAAIDAGSATLMTSFNELDGVPATGHKFLLRTILREEWGFDGMVVSDWASISEMINHGNVADRAEAAALSIQAGTDMDMMSYAYINELPELVASGKVDEKLVDQAVFNVLKLKIDLGLFDDPYRYTDSTREKKDIRSEENLAVAREAAQKSVVLLRNKNNILPLKKEMGSLALVGPYATEKAEHNGAWSFFGEAQHPVSVAEGITATAPDVNLVTHVGATFFDSNPGDAIAAATLGKRSEVIVAAIGEPSVMSGEGASRADIRIPENQLRLLEELKKTGKPIVAIVHCGRALDLTWLAENVDAVLVVWSLGSEAGNAIASVLFGDYNPSGRLPISFPRSVGQVPIFYSHKNTGRMYRGDYSEHPSLRIYQSRYRDVENSPLYPFGYGLGYSAFEYGEATLSDRSMKAGGSIEASVEVTNTGNVPGEETVQLYIQDLVGSVTRPVKELKGFQKVALAPGEKKKVTFTITEKELVFLRGDMTWGTEPGDFKAMVGPNSRDTKEAGFKLE